VVVSLAWWIHACDPSEGLKLDQAIADVAWVMRNLISLLSVEAIYNSDSESAPPDDTPPPRPAKRSNPVKVDPPPKRAKRART
jgi:hypothetical protein